MKKIWLSLLVAFIFGLSSGVVSSFAAEGSHMEMDGSHMEMDASRMDAGKADVAIDGYCPVAISKGMYVKGDEQYSTEYNGKTYYFVGSRPLEIFMNDPESYLQDLERKYEQLKMQSGGSHKAEGSRNAEGSRETEGSHKAEGSH